MRQVYLRISHHGLYELGIDLKFTIGKKARRIFLKFYCEPQFPSDAKIVKIMSKPSYDICYFYIESQEYPDVFAPTELNLVFHKDNIWKGREKVVFT